MCQRLISSHRHLLRGHRHREEPPGLSQLLSCSSYYGVILTKFCSVLFRTCLKLSFMMYAAWVKASVLPAAIYDFLVTPIPEIQCCSKFEQNALTNSIKVAIPKPWSFRVILNLFLISSKILLNNHLRDSILHNLHQSTARSSNVCGTGVRVPT